MNKRDEMVIVPPDPKKHLPEMFEMCSQVFSKGMGYYGCYDWCKNSYIMNSNYDWKSSAIGILDGKIVTHFGIWDYQMRIGSARVRVGGVGLVATHGDYRKHGLMGKTARASMDYLAKNGYDMSLLFGIANYYDRFGFVDCWDTTSYTIESHHLPKDKPTRKVEKFEPEHRTDLAKLYNQANATRTGTAVRPTFLRNQGPGKWTGYLWKDGRGKVAGYVVVNFDNDSLNVLDSVGDAKETLAVLGMLLKKLGGKNIGFGGLHYDDPLRKLICSQSYSFVRTNYVRNGGPMAATVNLRTTLEKMEGELSKRVKNSCLADWKGSFLIADGREKVTLAIKGAKVKAGSPVKTKHTLRGGNHVTQLLMGSFDPKETVEDAGMKLTGDAECLVEALFPEQHPMLARWDHF